MNKKRSSKVFFQEEMKFNDREKGIGREKEKEKKIKLH